MSTAYPTWEQQFVAAITQANKAFNQNPTPALSTVIKRMVGQLRYERSIK